MDAKAYCIALENGENGMIILSVGLPNYLLLCLWTRKMDEYRKVIK